MYRKCIALLLIGHVGAYCSNDFNSCPYSMLNDKQNPYLEGLHSESSPDINKIILILGNYCNRLCATTAMTRPTKEWEESIYGAISIFTYLNENFKQCPSYVPYFCIRRIAKEFF